MLAPVASIHVLNTAFDQQRRGWSGQARPWRRCRAMGSGLGPAARPGM